MARMALKHYLQDNWPQLALVVATNTASIFLSMQVTQARLSAEVEGLANRIAKVERAEPDHLRWQVDQQQAAIVAVQAQQAQTQTAIAATNITLAQVNVK